MAQEIQRQLEEVEIKQREVEKQGVTIERALRGDGSGETKCGKSTTLVILRITGYWLLIQELDTLWQKTSSLTN